MGRRKIEIKAIKDDRNRSVTFLKRKGGLFKKAHELSVLCSVDVAVIIFGHNKKLYEFSSGDVDEIIQRRNYYGTPHEHKGPNDFLGKGGGIDDDDDEEGSPAPESNHSGEQQLSQHLQPMTLGMNRTNTMSASPPMQHHKSNSLSIPAGYDITQRRATSPGRPPSRNGHHQRHRSGPGLIHPATLPMTQQQSQTNGYYNMPMQYNTQGQPMSHLGPNMQQVPQHQFNGHPANQAQNFLQQQYEIERRRSMPPAFPPNHPVHQIQHHSRQSSMAQPPTMAQQSSQHQHEEQLPPPQENNEAPTQPPLPLPEPIKRLNSKSRSMFTPIASETSLLAQHWGIGITSSGPAESLARSQSFDVAAISRNQTSTAPPRVPIAPVAPLEEATVKSESPKSRPVLPHIQTNNDIPPPPQRTSSMISTPGSGGSKRPVLKVQIPSEHSDNEGSTAGVSPSNLATGDATSATKANNEGSSSSHSSVVLPPPSPSVSNTIHSAGTSGPLNPFARPPPTSQALPPDQTPLSALPSRFTEGLLPSPSTFFSDWQMPFSGGGLRSDNDMLASPMNFRTPTLGRMFSDEDTTNPAKRKSPDSADVGDASVKRVKA